MTRRISTKFQGKELFLALDSEADESVYEEIFVDRDYRLLDAYFKKAKIIIDIGAHIGLFSLYASVMAPGAKIVSYEPEESNYAKLKAHLKENRIQNVQSKNLAVVGKEGPRKLVISEDSHNHSFYLEGEGKAVNTIGIKRLMEHVEHCDLMKIDCEGSEFEIFEEMDAEIFKKISLIYVEYHEFADDMKASKLKAKLDKHYANVKIFPSHYDKRMGFLFAH